MIISVQAIVPYLEVIFMKNYMKTGAAFCAALMMSAAVGCGSETGSSQSGSEAPTDSKAATTTTAPIVEDLGNLDLSDVTNVYDIPADFSFTAEAEDGTLGGGAAVLDQAFLGDFTGTGFVSIASAGDEVSLDVEVPSEGSYNITLRMAADAEGMSNLITIDGNALTSFTSQSTDFSDTVAENVLISSAGSHTIGIRGDKGHIYIDSITITPAAALDLSQYKVENKLSNPNASDEAKRLFNFLTDVYGKYTISGQSAGDNEGKDCREFKEILKHTGKTPAILGLDVMNLGVSAVNKGAGGGDMVPLQAMDWVNNEGGIVSMQWHWYPPEQYMEYNGGAWWQGFYTEYTNFDLAKAMNGEDQEGYDALVAEIDNMAQQLKPLAEANVPILWRPLHEAAGDPDWPQNQWFWWGAGGKDAYIKLWQLMYDKFTNEYELNNLIWVWNAQSPSWYPGDDYVDILSFDCYPAEHDYSSQKNRYDLLKTATPTNKIIAMSENGTIFDPETAFNDGTRWAYFMTWNGEFCLKDKQLSGQYTEIDQWSKVYNSERVLTLDELPNLKTYPLDTESFLAGGQ